MKRLFLMSVLFVAAGLLVSASAESVNSKPFVVPELQQWTGGEGGAHVKRIVARKGTAEVARQMAADWKEMFGETLPVVTSGKLQAGDVELCLKKTTDNRQRTTDKGQHAELAAEAYDLTISEKGTTLTAPTATGLYWGTRTILQIAEQNADRDLPCGVCHDEPQYALRGFMIDCGRKFFPMSYLKDLAKCMAYYKMNTLQIHLNDNGFKQYFGGDWDKTPAAFRLESTNFPGLTAKDGSYGKEEFKAFQKEAAKMGVEVVPEIDIPAHCLAFSHYRPSLGSKEFGMDHLDLFNEDLYPFLDSLFAEYLGGKDPVFVGKTVNIGTDEYSNAKKEVVEKFRYFTDRYLRLVKSYGKTPACWGSLTHAKGETPVTNDGVVMNCWYNGYAQPRDMKEQGYKLVSIPDGYVYIVPAAGYYYDYLNTQMLYNGWTPAQIGGEKFEEQDESLLGGMFAVWNDHAGNGITVRDVHDRVMPALQTLAVKCWRGAETKVPYEEFNMNRLMLSEAPGVNQLARGKNADGLWLLPHENQELLCLDELPANTTLRGPEEIGYGYEVSFHLEGADEAKGTVLTKTDETTFYLSDPETGRLGFEREGYFCAFNYRVNKNVNEDITIVCNNNETVLLVNGKVRERLNRQKLLTATDKGRNPYLQNNKQMWVPEVFPEDNKSVMYFQRTLVFPLKETGAFKSKVTNFRVTASPRRS
ncbi:MAG: family 20 glycosylhydrolase [Bacteroidaceae bacterium]|nr:family 20 glycosylhydrolase [Bacteroidaceae bacterium]